MAVTLLSVILCLLLKKTWTKLGVILQKQKYKNMSKKQLKKFINEKIVDTAFKHLKEENEKKNKTKHNLGVCNISRKSMINKKLLILDNSVHFYLDMKIFTTSLMLP